MEVLVGVLDWVTAWPIAASLAAVLESRGRSVDFFSLDPNYAVTNAAALCERCSVVVRVPSGGAAGSYDDRPHGLPAV